MLDLLGINAETPLAASTDGKCLVVDPVRDPQRTKRVREALEGVNRRHGRALALKRLAES